MNNATSACFVVAWAVYCMEAVNSKGNIGRDFLENDPPYDTSVSGCQELHGQDGLVTSNSSCQSDSCFIIFSTLILKRMW